MGRDVPEGKSFLTALIPISRSCSTSAAPSAWRHPRLHAWKRMDQRLRASGCRSWRRPSPVRHSVLPVGYRPAPAHLFPTGLRDCADALGVIKDRAPAKQRVVRRWTFRRRSLCGLAGRAQHLVEGALCSPPIRSAGACPYPERIFLAKDPGSKTCGPAFWDRVPRRGPPAPIHEISDRNAASGRLRPARAFPHLIGPKRRRWFSAYRPSRQPGAIAGTRRNCNHFEASYHTGDPEGVLVQSRHRVHASTTAPEADDPIAARDEARAPATARERIGTYRWPRATSGASSRAGSSWQRQSRSSAAPVISCPICLTIP